MALARCCCFSLKTGTLMIGILGLVGCVYCLLAGFLEYESNCSAEKLRLQKEDCGWAACQRVEYVAVGVSGLLVTPLMIYGSQKEDHRFMIGYNVSGAIFLLMFLIHIWYLVIISFSVSIPTGILYLINGNLVIGLEIYLWLVVFSRTKEIKKLPIATNGDFA